jgi:hypothetical protein
MYKSLIEKCGEKRPFGRPVFRCEINIERYVTEIGLKSVDWIYLAQDRDCWQAFVKVIMNS